MSIWCHYSDFSTGSQHGWSLTWPARINYGLWDFATNSWKTKRLDSADRLYLWFPIPSSAVITSIKFTYKATGTGLSTSLCIARYRGGVFYPIYAPATLDGTLHDYVWTGEEVFDAIGCQIILTSGTGYITTVEVEGKYVNPFVSSIVLSDSTQVPSQTAYRYDYPITGNPTWQDYEVNADPQAVAIDSYVIDPLNKNLWVNLPIFSYTEGWFSVSATDFTSGTVLQPIAHCQWQQNDSYTGSDRIIIPPNPPYGGNLRLPLSQILRIVSNGVANVGDDYPLDIVPWPATSTDLPVFTRFPLSLGQVCAGSLNDIFGLNADTGVIDYPTHGHAGTDIFAPSGSKVYSIADQGLVVGIGIGSTSGSFNLRSAAPWGSAAVSDGVSGSPGYSVIIRYAHLYVLYGHLKTLDSTIHVGKQVNTGTLVGQLGTSTNDGAYAHLHIEIRSFGTTVEDGAVRVLVKDENGNNNPYGILDLGGGHARNYYDLLQFFSSSTTTDFSDSSSTLVSVTPLGISITANTQIIFGTTAPPSPCTNGTQPQREFVLGTILETANGYRGFHEYVEDPPLVEPDDVSVIP